MVSFILNPFNDNDWFHPLTFQWQWLVSSSTLSMTMIGFTPPYLSMTMVSFILNPFMIMIGFKLWFHDNDCSQFITFQWQWLVASSYLSMIMVDFTLLLFNDNDWFHPFTFQWQWLVASSYISMTLISFTLSPFNDNGWFHPPIFQWHWLASLAYLSMIMADFILLPLNNNGWFHPPTFQW